MQLGFPPDWHFNALDDTRVANDCHWSEIDVDAIHDVKFVWEPSRFSACYVLARAYAASRNERYPEAFWKLVDDWAHRNPPNHGVNWASGQEVAFRVMAWCFGLYAFLSSPASTDARISRLIRMIEVHGVRIAGFIDYGLSQRNNHGVSEAVGLFTIGVLFPELRLADQWKNLGSKLIESQIREQVYVDGSYIQHSFNYQRLLIDCLVWAFRLGEMNNEPFSAESHEILERAVQFMLRFCDSMTGTMPNYGSNDGSLLLPLSSCDFLDFRPSLQAAHFFLNRKFYFEEGIWDEQSEWIFGTELSRARQSRCRESGSEIPNNHPVSGYVRLVARESQTMLRVAHYRHRPGQADQLHFDLRWRGQNIACDAGTYLYNAASPWDNGLARTAVHNSIIVGNRDQMTRVGRFLWVDWAQAKWREYETADSHRAIEAWHDGYGQVGVKCRRSVISLADEDCWITVDDVDGSSHQDVRLHWLFPEYPYQFESESRLKLQTPAGDFQGCFHTTQPHTATLVIGGRTAANVKNISEHNDEARGWRSLYYGEKEQALSYAIETHWIPVRFVTVLAPATINVIRADETAVEIASNGEKCGVLLRPPGSLRIFQ